MPGVPEDLFFRCINIAVARNAEFVPPSESGASLYIRPLLFGSSAQLGLSPPEEYTFVVYVLPVGVYHGTAAVDALVLETFDRAAPNGTGSAKVGGNYAPVLPHSEAAYKAGYGITLHLDSKSHRFIDEFSTSGFLGIRYDGDKTTLVVADSENVIRSVTSDSVQTIARDLGWAVEKRQVTFEEVEGLHEVMAAGTAAALVPVKSIERKSTATKYVYDYGGQNPKGVTTLLEHLRGIQAGKLEDKHGWRVPVTEVGEDENAKDATNEADLDAVNAL